MSLKTPLRHLAIIMDGNGRWAEQRGLPRTKGHEQGAKTIRSIIEYCSQSISIETLTLYAFSTENWKRPKKEIDFLMKLLEKYLESETKTYHEFGIRFETIGDMSKFSKKLQNKIQNLKEETSTYTNLIQILALNYGGQDEIVRAINKLIKNNQEITKSNLNLTLDTPYENVDLIIRTGGEHRISNFLLWQLSYSELHFSDTLWPDFNVGELEEILSAFHNKKRKFGGL